jgi:hypothetical protein
MARVSSINDKQFLEKFRDLPEVKKQEVIDFLDFLSAREKATQWIDFDVWALNLAKRKGFSDLSGEDVARIVSDFRTE